MCALLTLIRLAIPSSDGLVEAEPPPFFFRPVFPFAWRAEAGRPTGGRQAIT
jgi:hypothetical protein